MQNQPLTDSIAPAYPRSSARARGATIGLILGSLLVGLGVRLYFVSRPPASSTRWDHHEYVRWGVLMREEGFNALYDHPPRETLMWNSKRGAAEIARHPEHYICNYPPLAAYLLYAEITALARVDDTLASNTPAARMIYAAFSIIGDVLVAAGCFALVRRASRHVYPGGRSPSLAAFPPAIVFAAVMLAPPFFLDSARWTQTDSWVLAPAVWMLWCMLPSVNSSPRVRAPLRVAAKLGERPSRWLAAGVLWGVALGLKTQGILFAPIWLFALLLNREKKRIVLGMLIAAIVLAASSIPFTLRSGLTWFEEAYVNNLSQTYKLTTLKAFNLWYLDLLICLDTDAGRVLLGLSKDTWGKLLLASAVIGSGVWLARQRYRHADVLVTFTAVTLLAAVVLPTRVHERYILLPIPFLIVLAAVRPRIWLALVPFILVASFQMTVLDWLGLGADSWPKIAEKVTKQYEEFRATMPPDQFAALPSPEQQLADADRPRFEAQRAALGREKWEWTLTLLELMAAAGLGVLALRSPAAAVGPSAQGESTAFVATGSRSPDGHRDRC